MTLYNDKAFSRTPLLPCLPGNPGRGDSFTQEELQKYQELNSERGTPNENIENVIKTGKAPEDSRYLK